MLALTLGDDARSLHLVTVQAPEATRPDDVIVRILQSGICGTDRSVLVGKFDARPGVIMGHEAVGIVEGTGDWVTNVKPGDRVVVNPTLFCGECLECRKGRFNHYVNKANNEIGIDRDGTFCEQIVLPAQFVVPVPDEISTDRATLIEPFCCALSNVTAAGVQPGSRVIILGGGPVGALASIAAALSGGQVTLVEANPHRRVLLQGVFDHPDMPTVSILEANRPPESQPRADVVIDTVGNLLETAVSLLAPKGTAVVMGYNSSAEARLRPIDILFGEYRIIGAGDYNYPMFQRAFDTGIRIPLERIITHKFGLSEYKQAFGFLSVNQENAYDALKVVLESRL
ncbi:alcohol dehydrogenase catalytic domain-containing protein [Cutibacterium acnes]|jgi:ROK family protein|nr:hypothetical protein AK827_09415 [Cutibacterium acnes]KPG67123.1 hypothetical protein AK828_02715 [Cutibacterium acnes]PZA01803.1 hypothetical protein Asn12ST33_03700 [Cutibacterium acnes]